MKSFTQDFTSDTQFFSGSNDALMSILPDDIFDQEMKSRFHMEHVHSTTASLATPVWNEEFHLFNTEPSMSDSPNSKERSFIRLVQPFDLFNNNQDLDYDSDFDLSDDDGDFCIDYHRTNTFQFITSQKILNCRNQFRDSLIGNCTFDQQDSSLFDDQPFEMEEDESMESHDLQEKFNENGIDLVIDIQVAEDGLFPM